MARNGKLIDTWDIELQGQRIKVEVRHYKATRGGGHFSAFNQLYDLLLSNTDIEKLRQETWKSLQEKVSLTWQRFYLVRISGSLPNPSAISDDEDDDPAQIQLDDIEGYPASSYRAERRLLFEYNLIEIGTSIDGKQVHRYVTRLDDLDPGTGQTHQHTTRGMPELGKVRKSFESSESLISLLPATPENANALQAMAAQFHRLSIALHELLHPDVIEKNIQVAATKLLVSQVPRLGAPIKPAKKPKPARTR